MNLINKDTNICLETEEIPTKINKFFAEIGPKLADSLPDVNIDYLNADIVNGEHEVLFELAETILEDVVKYVKELSVYKSSGISDLGSRLLKDAFLYLPNVLLDIFNKVVLNNKFPDSWKIATVIPLLKIDNPRMPSDLRPISLLPIMGKIMEKRLHAQLKDYLEKRNLLAGQQHGFRTNHSTLSMCTRFVDDTMLGLDESDITMAVFLDIRKAFDSINHFILLKKLEKLVIGTNTLNVIRDYLNNRKQCVLYNNIYSDKLALTTGVPQGSSLGPLLFMVYINDLPDILLYCKYLPFADDTVLYLGRKDEGTVYTEMQLDLDAVHAWCNNNQITLNQAKTEYIRFSFRKITRYPEPSLKFGDSNISKTDSYKYLITLNDSKLNCQPKHNNIIKKLSAKKITFSKIQKLCNTAFVE